MRQSNSGSSYERSGPVESRLRLRARQDPFQNWSRTFSLEEADFASAIIVEQDYDAYLGIS